MSAVSFTPRVFWSLPIHPYGSAICLLTVMSVGMAQSADTRYVRPDVYTAILNLQKGAGLSSAEFTALLLSQQQHELAATVQQPSPAQLNDYVLAQALSKACLTPVLTRITVPGRAPWLPNTLEDPVRLRTFLKFTATVDFKKAETAATGLTAAQACDRAARMAR